MKIPFGKQSYVAESIQISAQRLINAYPELNPRDAKTVIALYGTPGLKEHVELGQGPIRGALKMGVYLYVVSGNSLFRLGSSGSHSNLGTIPGSSMVDMAHNGTQVAILTGTEADNLYIATETTLSLVTDTDFPGATSVSFLDGYFVFTETDSGRFFISASYDGTSYNALEFATAEGSPDNLVGAIVDHRELWLAGEHTIEVWYNSGAADFPFERASGAYIERGCIAKRSMAKMDNSVFWVGDDGVVYRANAYTPARISTHPIENILEENHGLGDLQAFTYAQNGHLFYVLKKPGVFTFVYDVATQLWHERCSHNRDDWRISTFSDAFDLVLVGDDKTGHIYELDPHTHTENGETFCFSVTSSPLFAEMETATMNNLILDFEPGVGITDGQGEDPQVMLDWSDDGGRTWCKEKWRSIGKIGEYQNRARWDQLGNFRLRVLRVSISDPVPRVMNSDAFSDLEGGSL